MTAPDPRTRQTRQILASCWTTASRLPNCCSSGSKLCLAEKCGRASPTTWRSRVPPCRQPRLLLLRQVGTVNGRARRHCCEGAARQPQPRPPQQRVTEGCAWKKEKLLDAGADDAPTSPIVTAFAPKLTRTAGPAVAPKATGYSAPRTSHGHAPPPRDSPPDRGTQPRVPS